MNSNRCILPQMAWESCPAACSRWDNGWSLLVPLQVTDWEQGWTSGTCPNAGLDLWLQEGRASESAVVIQCNGQMFQRILSKRYEFCVLANWRHIQEQMLLQRCYVLRMYIHCVLEGVQLAKSAPWLLIQTFLSTYSYCTEQDLWQNIQKSRVRLITLTCFTVLKDLLIFVHYILSKKVVQTHFRISLTVRNMVK